VAVVWGITTWVWAALGVVFVAGALLIFRVLRATFAALGELKESLELSSRLVQSALETTRDEATRAQESLARLGRKDAAADEQPWSDW
jgi:hypothetical protein